ncbi:MAG: preprotein translocase subunit SecE [Candidatus Omnitrophica bacterium]|nr:preprotein translocase subunit SecE [Candidatus Omnitrophota bacterium]
MKIFERMVNFFKEVKIEMTKVSWPTRQEVWGATVVVIVITSILALFIGIVDLILSKILTVIFR